ncbi:GspE/PulE family protein [Patescibacteria group bacterium]|nr:GspE/PulE family protein [Patescibacteria group bacterium]
MPDEKLKEFLVADGLITSGAFDELAAEAQRMEQNMADVLISRNVMTQEYFDELLSKYFGVKKANLSSQNVDEEVLRLVPEEVSREKKIVAFQREPDGSVAVAMEDPGDLGTIEYLRRFLSAEIHPFLASESDLTYAQSLYSRGGAEYYRKMIEENVATSLRSQVSGGAEEAAQDLPIVAIVDNLIAYAASSRASDIHIEIFEDMLLVRYRIDGVLHEVLRLPKQVHSPITARIKLLANLKLDEHSKPQDGRFRQTVGNETIDLRVSIIPTFYGEKAEMRLLTAAQRPLSFEEIGMLDDTIAIIKENIAKSFGMVLISGPNGSGKTTTLYSILNVLNKPDVDIVTVEDPVEYNIKYVNQTQVNPAAGITFAGALRAFLRQDPNIVLVGEIRDEETADISVNAALTGHLLLSTVHTNDAPTVIPRLLDMKVPPFLVAAVLNLAMAQRLVGRICPDCIESYAPDQTTLGVIMEQMTSLGVEGYKPPKAIYRGKGCANCGHTGLRGRIGIFEAMSVDEEIRKYIADPSFSLDQLRKLARKKGMITMFEDGMRKVERGNTTVEEVLRVIRE